MGNLHNEQQGPNSFNMCSNLLIIGISGVTCGGKTTLAEALKRIIPSALLISQDSYFLDNDDPRHVWISELNHVNYDIITSLDMQQMYKDVCEITSKYNLISDKIDIQTDQETYDNVEEKVCAKLSETNTKLLILEGFCIFNYKLLSDLCLLKFYFTLSKEECYKRRIKRVYNPPDCPGYFEKCAWPEYLNLYQYVRDNISDTIYFDGSLTSQISSTLNNINDVLQQIF
ncbi:hypothetical protein FQA39_LY05440 [Lamprigera yunnana]|nr:hypothetical protein FQA39_LY05440 [Lamprigera yunnana]